MNTQTTSYKPTLMQKILGRNYKWWYVFIFYTKSYGSHIFSFLISQMSDIMLGLVVVYIWVINMASPTVISYLIIGRIFKALSDCFVAEEISPLILNGKISSFLMFPTSFGSIIFIREIGRRVIFNVSRASALLVTILFYYQSMDFGFVNLPNLLLLLPLVMLSFLTSYYLEFMIGMSISFFHDKRNFNGIKRAYNGFLSIMTGLMIPLDKLPFYKEIIQFLPTTWSLHHPMQIYLGNYSTLETFYVFAGGIAWCIILYLLSKLIFKLGLKKNEAVGL